MYLGIDLGTSAVKALLVNDDNELVAEHSAPIPIDRPHPLWSEQDPADWWRGVQAAVGGLRESHSNAFKSTRAIGLTGQMHGATLLDSQATPLRPAILWNDGRCEAECRELESRVPDARKITGNIAMPGFTAPKLLWVANHEPEVFLQVAQVVLPKDYIRWNLTGDFASDLSDSAGTLWLDVAKREWSLEMLEACELSLDHMPRLYEGSQVTGTLSGFVARAWGLDRVPVAAGGGDNAAGAAGVGVVSPGQAFLSLGTSGVYFVSDDTYRPNPEGAVHTFCHCLPKKWHQMAVILSAASCIDWIAKLSGAQSSKALLAEIEADYCETPDRISPVVFLPYLSGERTPHNNPRAMGNFFGLTHDTTRADLGQAVLEGVAFAFADGQKALMDAGTEIREVTVIGGGARSAYWGRILASVLDRPLTYRSGGEAGPAFGAARLARIALTGESPEEICIAPPEIRVVEPDPTLRDRYRGRLELFRGLYANLEDSFAALSDPTKESTQ